MSAHKARKRHLACWISVLTLLVTLASLRPDTFAQAPRNVDATSSGDGGGDIDVKAIVRETETSGSAMHKRLLDYTYTQERTLGSGGKFSGTSRHVYEAYPTSQRHVLIHLSTDGVAIPPWSIASQRKDAAREMEKAELESSRALTSDVSADAVPPSHITVRLSRHVVSGKQRSLILSISDFLRSCDFSTPRRVLLDNRETLVLDFRARPDANFHPTKAFIAKLVGSVWIDTRDRAVVRLEGHTASEFTGERATNKSAPHPSMIVTFEQIRLPEGLWVPSRLQWHASKEATRFGVVPWDVTIVFKNYKRFSTNSDRTDFYEPVRRP